MMTQRARIVASHGKSYIVELPDDRRLSASVRGKKTHFACGDWVEVKVLNAEQAVIEKLLARESLLYRSDLWREKLIAANVTQIVIVTAPVPSCYEELISRCLLAAEAVGIKALIVANKSDLPEFDVLRKLLQPYLALGYSMIELSAKGDIAPLRHALQGEVSALVGQSGMGKSTLVNALLPGQDVRTAEISTALDSGKHTTTHASLYHLPDGGELIDSPGMQEFGLRHLKVDELTRMFPEFRPYLGECRFHNCRHKAEPGCALQAARDQGLVLPQRLSLLQALFDEVSS
ncbi:ribosome small subunit-dependent GTPase A [Chitinimonas sp. DQS-5]|uniref:Small ribosomal subunit biogenesis GTPase RsgA n=2 Tax=Parachitinimonas caeni TaxID=3031301 RepID=A0ABT7DXA1_9NEIS|nr:ribosome small subunit-dependent GTPase A [Parachitinimonas caeni]